MASQVSALRLFDLIQSHRVTAVIYVAAKLGLAELLRDGPQTPGALAKATGADERSLGRQPMEKVTGDRVVGEALFRGKAGCLGCHTVGFQGGRMGPVLSGIGASRGTAYLRQTLLDPESRERKDFGFVEVSLKGGTRVRGLRVNEDTQSLQLRDLSGNLHSYWKDELAEINYLFGKTPMPSVRALLNDAELNDLIAYLTTLRDIQ